MRTIGRALAVVTIVLIAAGLLVGWFKPDHVQPALPHSQAMVRHEKSRGKLQLPTHTTTNFATARSVGQSWLAWFRDHDRQQHAAAAAGGGGAGVGAGAGGGNDDGHNPGLIKNFNDQDKFHHDDWNSILMSKKKLKTGVIRRAVNETFTSSLPSSSSSSSFSFSSSSSSSSQSSLSLITTSSLFASSNTLPSSTVTTSGNQSSSSSPSSSGSTSIFTSVITNSVGSAVSTVTRTTLIINHLTSSSSASSSRPAPQLQTTEAANLASVATADYFVMVLCFCVFAITCIISN
ncbi:hypothetical protein V1514DRAFT_343967 [Lipomyces japonicus]|uniref:uncharacterized protein n=1 Tax=Lipomyces japonicus TaxID=56871 RepID=UPI0034CE3656